MESLKLLQEIEAWLSFNQEPSKEELAKLRKDINSHVSEQLNKPAVSKSGEDERKALLIDFCEIYAKGGWEDADDTEGIVNWYLRVKDN